MKKLTKYLLFLIAFLLFIQFQARATFTYLINGPLYTNATQFLYLTNNPTPPAITTNQIGVIIAFATNVYTLPVIGASVSSSSILVSGIQGTNNQWPCAIVAMAGGYPNTLYGPFQNVDLSFNMPLMSQATAANGQFFVTFATSDDGILWNTNAYVLPISSVGNFRTNINFGGLQYLALQCIQNTNSIAGTNFVIAVGGKPGL